MGNPVEPMVDESQVEEVIMRDVRENLDDYFFRKPIKILPLTATRKHSHFPQSGEANPVF
jgi:hypothetical protein